MQNKSKMNYYYTSRRVTKIKNSNYIKFWQENEATNTLDVGSESVKQSIHFGIAKHCLAGSYEVKHA